MLLKRSLPICPKRKPERIWGTGRTYGINTLWFNLLCNSQMDATKMGRPLIGIAPFIVVGDLPFLIAAYFQRTDRMINIAVR